MKEKKFKLPAGFWAVLDRIFWPLLALGIAFLLYQATERMLG